MPAFSTIHQSMLSMASIIFCVSLVLLAFFIVSVLRTIRKARLFSVPLMEEQEVEFDEAGTVVLWGEGPLLTTRFGHLAYELSADNVTPMEGRPILLRQTASGFSKARISLRKFDIPKPGRYVLRIQGLGTPHDNDAEHQLAFMRPHLLQAVAYVVGIAFSAVLLIASLVFFLLRISGV